ncbi:MAG: hypothetical protein JXQ73_14990 [Phycisphaerae bacterium]|nr:hypothetical protein [Phycisphaerae bacterium]
MKPRWFSREDGDLGGRPIPAFLEPKVVNAYLSMLGQFFYAQQGKETLPLGY